jgi:hypothetical protein
VTIYKQGRKVIRKGTKVNRNHKCSTTFCSLIWIRVKNYWLCLYYCKINGKNQGKHLHCKKKIMCCVTGYFQIHWDAKKFHVRQDKTFIFYDNKLFFLLTLLTWKFHIMQFENFMLRDMKLFWHSSVLESFLLFNTVFL